MPEQNLIERLDEAVEAIVRGGQAPSAVPEPELAMLLAIASDLRELPNPQFKQQLKEELMPVQFEVELKAGFRTVTPYLAVRGAADLIDFLKNAFGAVEHERFLAPDGSRILHAEVTVGDSMIEIGDTPQIVTPAALHLYVDDADATYQRALAAGAASMYAPMDQPYGDREAGVSDRWGNQWFIATRQVGGPRPEGFGTVTPFLFPSDARKMIDFLERTFDATLVEPPATNPEGRVLHAALRIGNPMVEMGEAHGQWQPIPMGLHVFVSDADAVFARALRAGGTVHTPIDVRHGQRGGAVNDGFGNFWYIATRK